MFERPREIKVSEERVSLQVGRYVVSPELFEKGFPLVGGPCHCTAVCCEGGVYADVAERNSVMENMEMVKQYMDETQSANESDWFEEVEFDDPDFPSGRCVGTRIINDKCAFLDKQGRCSLQVAATAEGLGRWALKPLFCILYPIEVSENAIGFDDLLQDEQPCCSIGDLNEVPVYRACREELIHLIGTDGYQAMENHYQRFYASDAMKGRS